jgi:t-SNARE complex subunit (syntaxin)
VGRWLIRVDNIDSVGINMENATEELRRADDYQRKARRRTWCFFLILAIIAIVVLVVVL